MDIQEKIAARKRELALEEQEKAKENAQVQKLEQKEKLKKTLKPLKNFIHRTWGVQDTGGKLVIVAMLFVLVGLLLSFFEVLLLLPLFIYPCYLVLKGKSLNNIWVKICSLIPIFIIILYIILNFPYEDAYENYNLNPISVIKVWLTFIVVPVISFVGIFIFFVKFNKVNKQLPKIMFILGILLTILRVSELLPLFVFVFVCALYIIGAFKAKNTIINSTVNTVSL